MCQGKQLRLIHGHDSFGNLCGEKNTPAINNSNSGLDLTDRPYLYYFDPADEYALQLCVAACPEQDVRKKKEEENEKKKKDIQKKEENQ